MKRDFSPSLSVEIASAVQSTLARSRIVNVSALARHIQRRNPFENVALEDIEYAVFDEAQRHGSPIEFAIEGEVSWDGAVAGDVDEARSGRFQDSIAGEVDGARVPLDRN